MGPIRREPSIRRLGPRAVGVAWALSASLALGIVPAGLGASPTSGHSDEPEPPGPGGLPLEAWLDRPLDLGAPPGSVVEVGAFVWDADAHAPAAGLSPLVRFQPLPGEPSEETAARQDFPGHYRASLRLPGGSDPILEIGLAATVCVNDDPCVRTFSTLPIAGSGPPPAADLTSLATARFDSLPSDVRSGQSVEVRVQVAHRADWGNAGPAFPDALAVVVRHPREPVLASATIEAAAEPGAYEGTVTIPEPGDIVLEVALDTDAQPVVFAESGVRVQVDGPQLAVPEPGNEPLPLPLLVGAIVAGLAGLVTVVWLARRLLTDL